MSNIHNLRRQHDAAEEIAAAILTLADNYRDEFDAIAIVRLLHKLNALLRVHFAYEDTTLYPDLMEAKDAAAAALAHRFHDEMGDLAIRFEDFARRWSLNAAVAARFDEFRREATTLFGALAARIERENDLLYPLAERSPQRAA